MIIMIALVMALAYLIREVEEYVVHALLLLQDLEVTVQGAVRVHSVATHNTCIRLRRQSTELNMDGRIQGPQQQVQDGRLKGALL